MSYEVWETQSGNLAGVYPVRRQALDAVNSFLRAHGRAALATFALVQIGPRGKQKTIARGDALAALAAAAGVPAFSDTISGTMHGVVPTGPMTVPTRTESDIPVSRSIGSGRAVRSG